MAEIILCRNCGRELYKSNERACGICLSCVLESDKRITIPIPRYWTDPDESETNKPT